MVNVFGTDEPELQPGESIRHQSVAATAGRLPVFGGGVIGLLYLTDRRLVFTAHRLFPFRQLPAFHGVRLDLPIVLITGVDVSPVWIPVLPIRRMGIHFHTSTGVRRFFVYDMGGWSDVLESVLPGVHRNA
jgi:hypothetical protein